LLPCDIKLVNWEEGNHTVNDYPNPRGEIHLSCDSLVIGYYKQPEKTREDFYQDNNGKRWIRSGDIGEFNSKGKLKVIKKKAQIWLRSSITLHFFTLQDH